MDSGGEGVDFVAVKVEDQGGVDSELGVGGGKRIQRAPGSFKVGEVNVVGAGGEETVRLTAGEGEMSAFKVESAFGIKLSEASVFWQGLFPGVETLGI